MEFTGAEVSPDTFPFWSVKITMKKLWNIAFLKQKPRSEQENQDPNELDLTQGDVEVIKRTWQSIANPTVLGQQIFLQIFTRNPHLKASFGLQSVPDENLIHVQRFRAHANNFMDFLTVVTVNLDRKLSVISFFTSKTEK